MSHSSAEACDSSVAGCKGVRQGEAPAVGRGVRGACPCDGAGRPACATVPLRWAGGLPPATGGAGGLPPASDRIDLLSFSFSLSLFLSFSLYQNCNI